MYASESRTDPTDFSSIHGEITSTMHEGGQGQRMQHVGKDNYSGDLGTRPFARVSRSTSDHMAVFDPLCVGAGTRR